MQPLLKHVPEITQPVTNGLSTDCNQHQADLVANTEQDFSAVSVVTSEEKIVLSSNDNVISIKSVAGSGLAAQGDVNINGSLETEQEQSSLTGQEEPESLKQNGDSKNKLKEPLPTCSSRQFFPPGRIIHMVAMASPDPNPGEGSSSNEIIGIYETPRDLYGKIRLAPNMIKEHYMPSYISTMESLLEQLLKDDNVDTITNDL
jgi:hypothetical protein